MNRILAIAHISLRSALRSKIVLLLMIPLAFGAVGVPLLLEGDGTLAGKSKILLNYSLWFSTLVLSIVTIWSGCASISTEIHEKLIHLVLAKPVSRLEVWFGKWISLLVLNAGLIAFSGLAVYIGLQWQTRDPGEEETSLRQQVLTSRQLLEHKRPVIPPEVVHDRYRVLTSQTNAEQGEVPPFAVMRRVIENQMMDQLYVVRRGQESMSWRIQVPKSRKADHPLFLRYKFSLVSRGTETESPGEFRFGNGAPAMEMLHESMRQHELEIPAEAVGPDGLLELTYFNGSAYDVHFDWKAGPALLVYKEPFQVNFVKAMFMIFFQLAFLSAVGVTCGALFSLPVAAFTSMFVILLQLFGGFLKNYQEVMDSGLLAPIYKLLALVTRPLQGAQVLESLSNGVQISLATVLTTFLFKVLIFCGVTAVLGTFLFNRREIGNPSTV